MRFVENQNMKQLLYKLDYSKVLSVPYLGDALYQLQIFLIEGDILHRGWVSRRSSIYKKSLLRLITARAQVIISSAWQLGQQHSELHANFVFDYQAKHPKHISLVDLYQLEWALILASSVTQRSVNRLGNLLPSSYPVWSPFIISVHQSLDSQCDFVWQTIHQLLDKGALVTILNHAQQSTNAKLKLQSLPKVNVINTSLPSIFSRLPYGVKEKITQLYEASIKLQLEELCLLNTSPVLWCFDPDDAMALRFKPERTTILYDCVDYFSSLNQTLQKRLEKDQRKLIRAAHLLFVNSRSLLKEHQKKRGDIILVPQGFDQKSFVLDKVGKTSQLSRQFQAKLHKEMKKYRAVATYVGSLSYRVDFQLLDKVIKANPKILFCLPETRLYWPTEDSVNPWGEQADILRVHKNILWFPPLSHPEVRQLLKNTTVGLIPYQDSYSFNKYCFPMKFFEYMSAHIPTLATQILELKYYYPFAETAKSAIEFSRLLRRLTRKKFKQQELQQMAQLCIEHSWESKVELITQKVSSYQRQHHRFS